MTPARELTAAIGGCLVGSALVVTATGERWAAGEGSRGAGLPVEVVQLTSSDLAPAASGLALLALASVAALVATRGVVRRLVGVLVLVAGAGIAVAAVHAGARARSAAEARLGATTRVDLTLTPWPWLAAAGGLLVVAVGLLVLVRGGGWPSLSPRYQTQVAPPVTTAADQTPDDLWRALDRGDDPTAR